MERAPKVRAIIGIFLVGTALFNAAGAAELQVRTIDGQTLVGEYIGTDNNIVKLRSRYGTINVPSKDIVTLTAVATRDKAKGDETAASDMAASEGPQQTFKEIRMPDLMSLVAARLADTPIAAPTNRERQEMYRAIRNFSDSMESSRQKIIRSVQNLGTLAYPFIAAAYIQPFEIGDRVELLSALAVPDSPFTAGIFADAHTTATNVMDQISTSPPAFPPEYPTKREREAGDGRPQLLKTAATDVLALEGYSSIAGGPFNTLFLLDVYKKRYDKEKQDPLLNNLARDSARLALAASDATRSNSSWTPDDRIMVADQALPMMFKDNAGYKSLVKELLQKILPSGHPKWEATEQAWVEWWQKKTKR